MIKFAMKILAIRKMFTFLMCILAKIQLLEIMKKIAMIIFTIGKI